MDWAVNHNKAVTESGETGAIHKQLVRSWRQEGGQLTERDMQAGPSIYTWLCMKTVDSLLGVDFSICSYHISFVKINYLQTSSLCMSCLF